MKPYTQSEILQTALDGKKLDPLRVVATYANPSNWKQVYGGRDSDGREYPCSWAWVGPVIVGYELAELSMPAVDALEDVRNWSQTLLTALNTGDIAKSSRLHLKLREVMIASR